jgi:hypothetical protein
MESQALMRMTMISIPRSCALSTTTLLTLMGVHAHGAEDLALSWGLNLSPACALSHRQPSLPPMNSKQLKERADHLEAQAVQLAADGEVAEAVVKSVEAEKMRELARAVARAEKKRKRR